ncbi:hypothetical protein QBC43DRAFT_286131 [Cladorrhinum sp. PSN259]|nr:hypothetical protein QBC43DRAFT_286131 [Cladorrhinum sp. PSN259]
MFDDDDSSYFTESRSSIADSASPHRAPAYSQRTPVYPQPAPAHLRPASAYSRSASSVSEAMSQSSKRLKRSKRSGVGCMEKHGYTFEGLVPPCWSLLALILTFLILAGGMDSINNFAPVSLLLVNTTSVPSHDGIEFYSVHVMSICMGQYLPEPRDPLAVASPVLCQSGLGDSGLSWNLVELIRQHSTNDSMLGDGATLNAMNKLSGIVHGICYLLIMSVVLGSMGAVGSAVTICYPLDPYRDKPTTGARNWVYTNLVATSLNAVFLFFAAALGMGQARATADGINMTNGGDIGIHAQTGQWFVMAWVTFGVTAIGVIWWVRMLLRILDLQVFGERSKPFFGQIRPEKKKKKNHGSPDPQEHPQAFQGGPPGLQPGLPPGFHPQFVR